ncbi:DUF2854 domain-containing protein [Prochlorococcus sp. MIT 1223]|uniref:DUF2854 domain-containing protein n=1 Tax=Prochlorococcus sp. MIT 1223 TaxID=3096217 RepID=UPI002A7521F8|nr:DUF2854 domain-containing protein [Prochlorococcus sp. MIT 1223]
MNPLFSPGSIITVTGAMLSVIGLLAYFTNATNLSVPTFFYGVPILLIGLSLKTVELPPAKKVGTSYTLSPKSEKESTNELKKVVKDVTGWKYGPASHLESSLKVLNLWDIDNPPRLIEVEELASINGYGIRLRFELAGVSLERWKEKEARLSRFFAQGLKAEITSPSSGVLDLALTPKTNSTEQANNEGSS